MEKRNLFDELMQGIKEMGKIKDQVYNIAWEIAEGLQGHMAMESVTGYLVKEINKKYGTLFENTDEMLEWAVANGGECFECPMCGWYNEWLDYIDPEQSMDGEQHEGCADCLAPLIK